MGGGGGGRSLISYSDESDKLRRLSLRQKLHSTGHLSGKSQMPAGAFERYFGPPKLSLNTQDVSIQVSFFQNTCWKSFHFLQVLESQEQQAYSFHYCRKILFYSLTTDNGNVSKRLPERFYIIYMHI